MDRLLKHISNISVAIYMVYTRGKIDSSVFVSYCFQAVKRAQKKIHMRLSGTDAMFDTTGAGETVNNGNVSGLKLSTARIFFFFFLILFASLILSVNFFCVIFSIQHLSQMF